MNKVPSWLSVDPNVNAPTQAQREQLSSDDVATPELIRTNLNDILLLLQARLEALEAARGLYIFEVAFDTFSTLAPTSPPWGAGNGSVKISCPFTPTGLVLLQVTKVQPSGQAISSLASDVKWHFVGGSGPGDGQIVIDFVTGLAVSSSYVIRVGVTRA